ncbi:MAG: hypothetical protein WBI17_12235 [Clostridiaceae bacterium]
MALGWKVKNEEKTEYKTAQGRTDYNIPMLGYRSALFLFVTAMAALTLVPFLMKQIFQDFRLPTAILTGLIVGFSVAFAQYRIERKKKVDNGFYLLGALMSIVIAGALFIVYYAGIMF